MTFRTVVAPGASASVDLLQLGASSGLLWRSVDTIVVGIGEHTRIELERPLGGSSAQTRLRELGSPGFAALPFRPDRTGELIVPDVTLIDQGGRRTLYAHESVDDAALDGLVNDCLASAVDAVPSEVSLRSTRSAEAWRDMVADATARLATSELQKVVLARELELVADVPFPIGPVVRSLLDRFGTANVFAVDGFVGASPELLVGRRGRLVTAHPLAGTAARSADPAEDAATIDRFLASTKDQVEHRITIEWLLEELLPYCSYVDAEPEPSIVTMPNVHHLATRVEGMLSEPAVSVLDLVAAIHPTPAVGGAPQADALAVIDEVEMMDRARYAGPTGWVSPDGDGEFAVSVRTAQLDGSAATVWAGVGVIEASDPDAELVETQMKFAAMLGTLLALS